MKRRPFRFPLLFERLEDRNAPNSLLAVDPLSGPLPPQVCPPQFFLAGR
jgi:hypothetical protein